MINCDINKLKALATVFRTAIEKCDFKSLTVEFCDFPFGSCGDTTLLLAKYLEQNNCGKFNYMLGERSGKAHAWLQQRNVIIDITADQFDDNSKAVIVTTDHHWHLSFNGEAQNIADFEIYDENTVQKLSSAYQKTLEEVKKDQIL